MANFHIKSNQSWRAFFSGQDIYKMYPPPAIDRVDQQIIGVRQSSQNLDFLTLFVVC